jgi:hypothetical protein
LGQLVGIMIVFSVVALIIEAIIVKLVEKKREK